MKDILAESTDAETPVNIADRAAEAIRELNHATLPWAGRLEYPADAYDVLGSLKVLAERLPQAGDQLARFLAAEVEADRVRAVEGHSHAGDPVAAVTAAEYWLEEAGRLAAQLREAWSQAQIAIAGLARGDDL